MAAGTALLGIALQATQGPHDPSLQRSAEGPAGPRFCAASAAQLEL